MKAFITGGTGFIGGHLVRRLIERGDEVVALVRSREGQESLEALGAKTVRGDITERETMRGRWPAGMQGCDVAFHVAAWYKIGGRDRAKAEQINVEGTRSVLELAHELGVPRIVYTSSVVVFGDTHGAIVDENYRMPTPGGVREFVTEYDRTKWIAHYEVALPLIERGAPVIIVMPGAVYGPGDHSLVGKLMQAWYRGFFPLFPGPETILTFPYIDDVVEGHLLAAEKGRPGESYVITGPALNLRELSQLWARLTGMPAPLAFVPARFLHPLEPIARALGERIPAWPELFSTDAIRILGTSYAARADKARRELGWETRPIEEGMRQTLDWVAEKIQAEPLLTPQQKRIGTLMLLAALGFLLLTKRRRKRY